MFKREGINMNDYLETKELYHHGIKGQKWGIIRKEYHQSRQEHAAKQEAGGIGTAAGAILGGAAGLGLSFLLNQSKKFKKTDGVFREVGTGETYKHSMASIAKRTTGMAFAGAMLGRKIGKAHAMKKSHQARVEEAKFDNLTAAQKKALLGAQQIQHSGIKGQRWGIRRYQNEDGSLTEEGKRRYGTAETYRAVGKEASVLEDVTGSVSGAVNTAASLLQTQRGSKAIRKNYSSLSDKELQDRINRLNLERAYGDLSGDTKYVQTGKEKTREILQTIGATLGIAAAAVKIYALLRGMKDPDIKQKVKEVKQATAQKS